MKFTFPECYMAIEFFADLKRAGIVPILSADKLTVTVAGTHVKKAAQVLVNACNQ